MNVKRPKNGMKLNPVLVFSTHVLRQSTRFTFASLQTNSAFQGILGIHVYYVMCIIQPLISDEEWMKKIKEFKEIFCKNTGIFIIGILKDGTKIREFKIKKRYDHCEYANAKESN